MSTNSDSLPPLHFGDSAGLVLDGLELPPRYALDQGWQARAADLPYALYGMLEWRAQGFESVDLLCAAKLGTHPWKSWWSSAMPVALAGAFSSVREAWVEQDATTASGDATRGFFWGIPEPDESTRAHPAVLLNTLTSAYPALISSSVAVRRWLDEGLRFAWFGVFPERATSDSLRLNLARRDSSDVRRVSTGHPEMETLVDRVESYLGDDISVAWCWDQQGDISTRLMAELSPHASITEFGARSSAMKTLLERVGHGEEWLEDALALHAAWDMRRWATIPATRQRTTFSCDVLLSPSNEQPKFSRQLSHIKLELNSAAPSGPLMVKLYGAFALPGSGMLKDSSPPNHQAVPNDISSVWPTLQQALADAPWPYTLEVVRAQMPVWAGRTDADLQKELQQRAEFAIASRALRAARR